MKLTKGSKFKYFTASSFTLWAQRVGRTSTLGSRGRSHLLRTHWVERAKNNLVLQKLNEITENVSFDFQFTQAFKEIQPFKVSLFVFVLNANFSKSSRADWVKQKQCFGPKVKKYSF